MDTKTDTRCPTCGTRLPPSMRFTGQRIRIRLKSFGMATTPAPVTDFALAA